MRSLRFDFQRKPSPSATGWLLLRAGAAVVAGAGHLHYDLEGQRAAQAARLARLQAPGGAAGPTGSEPDEAPVQAARQLLDKARLPWDTLFAALETADTKDVALLSIDPDPQRRVVKIHGEARSLDAMLEFQRRLQQNPTLAQVVLSDHTVMKDVPFTPVRFHIQAQWGVQRVHP